MTRLEPRTEKDEHALWYRILCEFLFGFLHITASSAVGLYGKTEKATRLLTPLGPLVESMHVEAYLGHWPANLKKGIEQEFLLHLSDAQKEYAACKSLVIEDKPLSREAVMWLLAFKVAECADRNDVADAATVFQLAVSAVADMNLRQLIVEVED